MEIRSVWRRMGIPILVVGLLGSALPPAWAPEDMGVIQPLR